MYKGPCLMTVFTDFAQPEIGLCSINKFSLYMVCEIKEGLKRLYLELCWEDKISKDKVILCMIYNSCLHANKYLPSLAFGRWK